MITNTFKSKYASTCQKCHKPIDVGDDLIRQDNGQFVHADCSSALEINQMCLCMPDYCPCKHRDVGCRYNAYLNDGIDRPKGPADDEIDLGLEYRDYYKPEIVKKVVDLFKAGKKVYLPVLGVPYRCAYLPYNCCCEKDNCLAYMSHMGIELPLPDVIPEIRAKVIKPEIEDSDSDEVDSEGLPKWFANREAPKLITIERVEKLTFEPEVENGESESD